jgi:hypothetical protein
MLTFQRSTILENNGLNIDFPTSNISIKSVSQEFLKIKIYTIFLLKISSEMNAVNRISNKMLGIP